jgi:hypothetical protein
MKVTKIVGLLLMVCLSGNTYTMEPAYAAEQQLTMGNLSTDTYLLMIEKSSGGHARMVNALRTADYRQSPDGNYYEQLIDMIDNMVVAIRRNQIDENLFRSLRFNIRRYVERYYYQLKDAQENGTVKRGRST